MANGITVNQIQGAIQTSASLLTEVQGLIQFLNQVYALANNNWQITENIGGVPVQVTLDAPTQAALLAQYTTLKQSLVATFAQLP